MHDDADNPEHFHPGPDAIIEDIEGVEMFSLKSVGIDIGSSTSHLVFSHLTLRREGAGLSAKFKVTDREVLYRSPIMLTPYTSGTLIDMQKVQDFIHESYRAAGYTHDDIDTGAVVITGEALNKENSRPILEYFAKDSGKFICASAGPNHEALLAAYGCGAVDLSKATNSTVLNIDMGGGTTKLSVIRDGTVTQTAAISVGARLIAFDEDNVVTRVELPARFITRELGHQIEVGKLITEKEKDAFASYMADYLFHVIQAQPLTDLETHLLVTDLLPNYNGLDSIQHIVFSGGVSEHIYNHDIPSYGDVGPYLGEHIRKRVAGLERTDLVKEPTEGIRATVIGAGEYTIQASGNTSYLSSDKPLPVYGLQVIKALIDEDADVQNAIRTALAKFDLQKFKSGLALALGLKGIPNYQFIRRVAEGIAAVVNDSDDPNANVFLILDIDVAKSIGGILKEELELKPEIIAVDSIDVGDLDFIDVGAAMGVTEVIPVTIRSFMFPESRLE
jgi:ethanolamine utilization protein EutA